MKFDNHGALRESRKYQYQTRQENLKIQNWSFLSPWLEQTMAENLGKTTKGSGMGKNLRGGKNLEIKTHVDFPPNNLNIGLWMLQKYLF